MVGASEASESHVDVLIVGAGPAGLMAAYWMARCGVKARIIDKRGTKIFNGQADGLRARTQELLDSMGIQSRVDQEGLEAWDFRVWAPDENGDIRRAARMLPSAATLAKSKYTIVGLNQGRIERFLLDAIKEHAPELQVERGVLAESLEYDESAEADYDAHPVAVTLRTLGDDEANPSPAYGAGAPRDGLFRSNLAPDDWEELVSKSRAKAGRTEVVRAKYLIGCDGAHSWTRKQLGIQLEGAATDHIWGVMDVVPISNFPDMRCPCAIRSEFGAILLVARERGLVRMYIPLQDPELGSERFDRSKVNVELLKKRAQQILKPYDFDFKICDWWSAYQVGQRVAPRMSNSAHRILLAGDATHTHSPKVGAGMNVSMQDGFNVGWKVALCAAGLLSPVAVLPTYNAERHPVAQKLAEYDRTWSPLFTGKPAAVDPRAFEETNAAFEDFAQGFVLGYGESPIVRKGSSEGKEGREEKKQLATTLVAGERFFPAKLAAQADGRAAWSTRVMRSDGCFRVVLLAGDVRAPAQMARVRALCARLTETGAPLQRLVAPAKEGEKRRVDVLAVHCAPRVAVELFDFPECLRPVDAERGVAYDRIWVDEDVAWDVECDGRAYEKWGVDRARGAVLVMRPDQYIGWIGEYEDAAGLEGYFEGILRKPA